MNYVPDLHRQGEGQNKDPLRSRTCSTLAETREKPKTVTKIVHESRERAEPTTQEKKETSTYEATLTDVFNTQLKD